jgi:hypothetical protein
VAQIKDPSRHRAKPARAYLLTGGVARCGPCGKPLHAQRKKDTRTYACVVGAEKGGCGGISIRADPLEEIVAETVMVALETPALVVGVDDDVYEAEVSALEARLDDLAVSGPTASLGGSGSRPARCWRSVWPRRSSEYSGRATGPPLVPTPASTCSARPARTGAAPGCRGLGRGSRGRLTGHSAGPSLRPVSGEDRATALAEPRCCSKVGVKRVDGFAPSRAHTESATCLLVH